MFNVVHAAADGEGTSSGHQSVRVVGKQTLVASPSRSSTFIPSEPDSDVPSASANPSAGPSGSYAAQMSSQQV